MPIKDGYPGILGYQGPALSEVAASTVTPLAGVIEGLMVRKSENEIVLTAVRSAGVAHGRMRSPTTSSSEQATCS